MACTRAQLRSRSIWFTSQQNLTMSHLMTNDATFLSVLDFKERYKIKPTFSSFMGIISAVSPKIFKDVKGV